MDACEYTDCERVALWVVVYRTRSGGVAAYDFCTLHTAVALDKTKVLEDTDVIYPPTVLHMHEARGIPYGRGGYGG